MKQNRNTRCSYPGSVFALAVSLLLCCVVPVTIAWTPTDDPGDDPPSGGGEWVATSYSASAQNTCNAAAGEVCKEWCVRTPNDNLVGTGDLCCVQGNICLTARP